MLGGPIPVFANLGKLKHSQIPEDVGELSHLQIMELFSNSLEERINSDLVFCTK
jgi:hypothetical protein